MLPRLEAEQELTAINVGTAAFGGMKSLDRSRYVGRLRQVASGVSRAARATPEVLAAMGIAVVVVPPSSSEGSDG